MAKESEPCGGFEWTINVPDGTPKILVLESVSQSRFSKRIHVIFGMELLLSRFGSFIKMAWKLGMNDPKKLIHCFKVGLALSLVSLFYYMRPLYEGTGGNAMWAVLTVVVVFEYTVGATVSKCLNKATATLLAGALGVGVHWIASQLEQKFEPIIIQGSVFLLAAATTFSRFIPSIKARFDYGALVFILTFSLVSFSGYRVGQLFEFAHHRVSTIVIGTSVCILTSMLFCPVWAGNELHNLIKSNMEKLADSLDGCVEEYFGNDTNANNTKSTEASSNILQGYICVLNSGAAEESLANFARWEPAHGHFNFRYSWKEYLKIGASLRSCAYCIEALNGIINSDTKALDFLKKHFSEFCIKLSSNTSMVLRELVVVTDTMTISNKTDLIVEGMCNAVEELENALEALYKLPIVSTVTDSGDGKGDSNGGPTVIQLTDVFPLVTLSSLLIETARRTEDAVRAVYGLVNKA